MTRDLLLEIGMEEVPARFLRGSMDQLKDRVVKWLSEARIEFGEVEAYATPRRIAVLIHQVAEKQQDINEEVKGPSRKIALDDSGNWSKAALGFARSQGVDPEQFYFKELSGVEYIYANKSSAGLETGAVLSEGLMHCISSMNFPKNMRWGAYDFKFVRPIRWMVALFGTDIIPLEICGVAASNVTRGHRFLGQETVVSEPSEYVAKLRDQFVIADLAEREQLILNQINALADEKQWKIAIKEDLLEEVLFLVEYPSALFGTFDPAFLEIPQEVLITSMREHQRYFPVLDASGQLLPFFVTVRNGNRHAIDTVAKGNEKVLRARLSDAKFFYDEDQNFPIANALAKLETIVFHEELGTVGDKVRRIRAISDKLAARLQTDTDTSKLVSRTADICKFDLVTQMVYEFPELQGVMGEDYARKAGEPVQVAAGINEHYQPRFSGDNSPASLIGAIVSIADKMDTIVGCFSIGIIPTGSADPYALRRQAAGIVQIILDHNLPIHLTELFDMAMDIHGSAQLLKRNRDEIRIDLCDFFALRVKNVFTDKVRYDVVDAVMASGFDHLVSVVARGTQLMKVVSEQSDFKVTVESFNRVSNLASKAESYEIQASKFVESVEQDLYNQHQAVHAKYHEALQVGDMVSALEQLSNLQDVITAYFDKVMVMAEDAEVRANRLAQLHAIAEDLKLFADFSKIVWA